MKQLILLNIILAALTAPVHAKTISVFATDVINTYGVFSQTAGGSALTDDAAIESIIASDPATAIFGNSPADADNPTGHSAIDLGFGDNKAFTGAGSDLVIFSLWYGNNYNFGLGVYGTDPSAEALSFFNYSVTGNSIFEECAVKDASGGCVADIATTSINLFGSDLKKLGDDIELDSIRLFIGGSTYNGDIGGLEAYSNFTLVGANYSDAMVVPLPLSSILFSSGLAFLGWIGRRKTV